MCDWLRRREFTQKPDHFQFLTTSKKCKSGGMLEPINSNLTSPDLTLSSSSISFQIESWTYGTICLLKWYLHLQQIPLKTKLTNSSMCICTPLISTYTTENYMLFNLLVKAEASTHALHTQNKTKSQNEWTTTSHIYERKIHQEKAKGWKA